MQLTGQPLEAKERQTFSEERDGPSEGHRNFPDCPSFYEGVLGYLLSLNSSDSDPSQHHQCRTSSRMPDTRWRREGWDNLKTVRKQGETRKGLFISTLRTRKRKHYCCIPFTREQKYMVASTILCPFKTVFSQLHNRPQIIDHQPSTKSMLSVSDDRAVMIRNRAALSSTPRKWSERPFGNFAK